MFFSKFIITTLHKVYIQKLASCVFPNLMLASWQFMRLSWRLFPFEKHLCIIYGGSFNQPWNIGKSCTYILPRPLVYLLQKYLHMCKNICTCGSVDWKETAASFHSLVCTSNGQNHEIFNLGFLHRTNHFSLVASILVRLLFFTSMFGYKIGSCWCFRFDFPNLSYKKQIKLTNCTKNNRYCFL